MARRYGVVCPTGGDAHGPLLPPKDRVDGRWVCPHEEHDRGVTLATPKGETRRSWTLDELQTAGVAP